MTSTFPPSTATAPALGPRLSLTVPSLRAVENAAGTLVRVMTEVGLDDPRWETAGPLVSAAALRLREALGTPVSGSCVSAPSVVRERDFTAAARTLLDDRVTLVDPWAGRAFVGLAVEAALALG